MDALMSERSLMLISVQIIFRMLHYLLYNFLSHVISYRQRLLPDLPGLHKPFALAENQFCERGLFCEQAQ
jgi:hypothetical protein